MDAAVLAKRLERERRAREEAERILEAKSRELFQSNERLKAASAELERQSGQLTAILENTRAGILLVDGEGRIRRVNRGAELLFGMGAAELEGHEAARLTEKADADALRAADAPTAARALSHARDDVVGRRADGTDFPMELAVAAVEIDSAPHAVWICRDITARKEAEARRAALESELAQAQKLESLGTLSAGIAHEINTPVQFVSDNVHFLKEAAGDLDAVFAAYAVLAEAIDSGGDVKAALTAARAAEAEADLAFVREEMPPALDQALVGLAQITKIVSAIKVFAHPGLQDRTDFNLNEAIDTTVTVSASQWKHVAELETDLQDGLPPVPGYPGELNQVFLNLIVNAAQAIEEAGAEGKGRIAIATRVEDRSAVVTVSDSGCGIAPENQGRIFDPFFTTKEVGKGTGQGLSLCYSIVTQKHGGQIAVASEPGKGTVFTIRLPLDAGKAEQAA